MSSFLLTSLFRLLFWLPPPPVPVPMLPFIEVFEKITALVYMCAGGACWIVLKFDEVVLLTGDSEVLAPTSFIMS